MFNTVYGKYFPVISRVHKMNSTSKLICVLLFMLVLTIGTNVFLIGILILLTFLMMLSSKVPLSLYLKSLYGIMPIIAFILICNFILKIPFSHSILVSVKFITGVLYTMILTYTTSTTEITYGLEQIFKPLEKIKIPVNMLASAFSIALRFIPTIFEQAEKILKAEAIRGMDFNHSNFNTKIRALSLMIFPMFSLAFNKIDNLADAMEVRLYNYNYRRTNYRMNKWNKFDDYMVTIHLFILVLFIIERFM